MGFSKDFLWGAAAASAQIEGGWKDGGRTPSIWDMATKKQEKHGETCHTACDHYHQWKEDVALMKEIEVFGFVRPHTGIEEPGADDIFQHFFQRQAVPFIHSQNGSMRPIIRNIAALFPILPRESR